jgi:hypothetical protein
VEGQGQVRIAGVPFPPGTEVEVTISPKPRRADGSAEPNGQDLAAARARMRELFATIKGFRGVPRLTREELYERDRLR